VVARIDTGVSQSGQLIVLMRFELLAIEDRRPDVNGTDQILTTSHGKSRKESSISPGGRVAEATRTRIGAPSSGR
jgi:hypothetical protein